MHVKILYIYKCKVRHGTDHLHAAQAFLSDGFVGDTFGDWKMWLIIHSAYRPLTYIKDLL